MLKRIRIEELTPGMFLHELCGSWMEHPFWRKQFLLEDAEDLSRIRATSITEVWIDTARGLDVAPNAIVTTREQTDAAIDTSFNQLGDLPAYEAPPDALARQSSHQTTSMEEELVKAALVCQQSKSAVYRCSTRRGWAEPSN